MTDPNTAVPDVIVLAPVPDPMEKKIEEHLAWGHINFEGTNGLVHNNCRAMEFESADEMNAWFKEHVGHFAAQVNITDGSIICIVDRVMDDDMREVMELKGEALSRIMAELKAQRDEAKEKQKAEEDRRTAELEDLVALGKKCKDNHGAVIEENAKLKKQLKAKAK